MQSSDGNGGAINLVKRMPFFETAFDVWEPFKTQPGISDALPPVMENLANGLVSGIRDYFARTGFKIAIVGLSGGIDSAVVAALAAKALGSRRVLAVAMPSQHSSHHSLADAEELVERADLGFEVQPIKFPYSVF